MKTTSDSDGHRDIRTEEADVGEQLRQLRERIAAGDIPPVDDEHRRHIVDRLNMTPRERVEANRRLIDQINVFRNARHLDR